MFFYNTPAYNKANKNNVFKKHIRSDLGSLSAASWSSKQSNGHVIISLHWLIYVQGYRDVFLHSTHPAEAYCFEMILIS